MKKVVGIFAIVMLLLGAVVYYMPGKAASAKTPNKAPEPATTAVTPPAAPEPRQP